MDRLEKYLEDIRTFLPGREPEKVDEILLEIKSHILERVERKYAHSDSGLELAIKEYGSPEQVAARYYEGGPIIAPHLKNYLFMYSGILFAIHMGVQLLGLILGENGAFFQFAPLDLIVILFQLPATYIFDFGLVSLILYFVTKSGTTGRLPHFTWFLKREKTPSVGMRIAAFAATAVGALITYLGFTYGLFYFENGQLNTLATAALDTFKFGMFLGFGLLAVESVSNFINIFNYSRFGKIVSNIAGLVFLFIVVSPMYSEQIMTFLNISQEGAGHPFVVGLLIFVVVVMVVELVLETIRFWASKIVAKL